MPPIRLRHLAAIHVPPSIAPALLVLADIFLLRRRQPMAIMDVVRPPTMLYRNPLGPMFRGWLGRAPVGNHSDHGTSSMWQATVDGATRCGTGPALFGSAPGGGGLAAFRLACAFGIVFQLIPIAPMRNLGARDGLIAAARTDTLSMLAHEVGMFTAMGLRAWAIPDLRPTTRSHWLLMQAAMVAGFPTTCPVDWWLVDRGIGEKMPF